MECDLTKIAALMSTAVFLRQATTVTSLNTVLTTKHVRGKKTVSTSMGPGGRWMGMPMDHHN